MAAAAVSVVRVPQRVRFGVCSGLKRLGVLGLVVAQAAAMRNPVTNLPLLLGTSDIEDWVVFEAGLGTEAERLAGLLQGRCVAVGVAGFEWLALPTPGATCCGGVGLSALADGLSADDWQALAKKSPSSNVTHV